ncbi:MAG: hypothetical protein ABS49_02495 [Erythrobacter sp. SCN 62-14]|nr:MAG: hypothetical protein ABS49_02495 [Erythrobacter sp. SCN 62-14]
MSARRFGQIALAGLGGAASAAVLASLAVAQSGPQSILPPGFDDPVVTPSPTPTPQPGTTPRPAQPGAGAAPAPQPGAPLPGVQPAPLPADLPPLPKLDREVLARLPSLEELDNLSTDEIDELLGLKPKFDIPPGARRALTRVGILSVAEGGLPPAALANQPVSLVRAALAGTKGPLVSRWGHILLRRALASRMAAPDGMEPAEFAALRAGVLNAIGEYTITRALVQDVDTNDWSSALTSEALAAYLATGDITGACPAVRLQGSAREDAEWKMLQAICNAYAGESALAASQLDRALGQGIAPRIDVLLARRFAGAAGRGQRAVEIEWKGVEDLNAWRFGLAHALGEPLPGALVDEALKTRGGGYYARAGALLPMLPPTERLRYAPRAASEGILSASALVDLYSQLYADPAAAGPLAAQAAQLREAYTASNPAARIAAMKRLWEVGGAATTTDGYGARVLTAYAAARIPASADYAEDAGELIAAMLTAGLDRDAATWRSLVKEGSLGWALIALAQPQRVSVGQGAVDQFASATSGRRAALLAAGLAGLDRFGGSLDASLTRQTRWSRLITRAAEVENAALVVLLAGLGMQGDSWQQMTPLHLYHITSALRRVGLEAEARMIAAEAVARSA